MTRQAALLAALAAALVDVQASMARRMGDATACQLHKDGRVTGGMKYDEGRLVALINLQRAVRTAESTNAAVDAAIAGEAARQAADRGVAEYPCAVLSRQACGRRPGRHCGMIAAPMRAARAGTGQPRCASSTISAFCRM